nr:MAG TPA: hypothetical protein [Caudoviricetes sp.]
MFLFIIFFCHRYAKSTPCLLWNIMSYIGKLEYRDLNPGPPDPKSGALPN